MPPVAVTAVTAAPLTRSPAAATNFTTEPPQPPLATALSATALAWVAPGHPRRFGVDQDFSVDL